MGFGLKDALLVLSEDDIAAAFDGGTRCPDLHAFCQDIGITADPRFMRGGIWKVIRARLKGLPPMGQLMAAGRLIDRPLPDGMDKDEDPGTVLWQLAQDQLDGETVRDIDALVAELVDLHGETLTVLLLTLCIEDGPNGEILIGARDALLPEPEPGDVEATEIEEPPPSDPDIPDLPDVPDGSEDRPSNGLFTLLDELLTRTTVATLIGQVGAPSLEALRLIVEEYVLLNTQRRESYFHLGYLSALDPEQPTAPTAGMNEYRWLWFHFGRLSGLVRSGELEVAARHVLAERACAIDILSDPFMGTGLLRRLIGHIADLDANAAVDLLRKTPATHGDLMAAVQTVHLRARKPMARGRPREVQRLLEAVLVHADTLAPFWPSGDIAVDVLLLIAAAARASNDFVSASEALDRIDPAADLTDADRSRIEVERGLTVGTFGETRHVRLPRDPDGAESMGSRLRVAEQHFRRAIELDPSEPRANFCMGVLVSCQGAFEDAIGYFGSAQRGFQNDEVARAQTLHAAASFYRALAELRSGVVGGENAAAKNMLNAVEDGYRASEAEWSIALEELIMRNASMASAVLEAAYGQHRDVRHLISHAKYLAEAGAPRALQIAAQMSTRPTGVTPAEKMELALSAQKGALVVGEAEIVDDTLDAIDTLLGATDDAGLAMRWAEHLGADQQLRAYLGLDADLLRVEVYRRHNQIADAFAIAERLFYRALNEQREGLDAADQLELLRELAEDPADLSAFEAALPHAAPPAVAPQRNVQIAFVGGNETQKRYTQPVESELRELFGSRVKVTWYFPGWSANWLPTAEEVERNYPTIDAVVLMHFVRTNFGRRIRRTCGDAGLPWIPCTGHGRASIQAAIEKAVAVVQERASAHH